jgi:hypothetical protein
MIAPSECPHDDFAATVDVRRLTDDDGHVRNYLAEITVRCARCGLPFHFVGPGCGFSFHRPTVNVGATMLHAPIAPGEGPLPDGIRFDMPPPKGSES